MLDGSEAGSDAATQWAKWTAEGCPVVTRGRSGNSNMVRGRLREVVRSKAAAGAARSLRDVRVQRTDQDSGPSVWVRD